MVRGYEPEKEDHEFDTRLGNFFLCVWNYPLRYLCVHTVNNKEFNPICSYADTRMNRYTGHMSSEYRNESMIDTIYWNDDVR